MEKEVVSVTGLANALTAVKAPSLGIATSSGGVYLGFATFSHITIALSIVALIVSSFAFLYDHYHTHIDTRESGMKMITTFAMYIIFGTPALPAGYNFAMSQYHDPMAGMVAGFFCSWVVVAIVKALKIRAVKKVEKGDL